MSDRPQYGEYATPEEQRRLAGLPPLDAVAEAPVATSAPATSAPSASAAAASAPAATAQKPAGRPWDRIITIALLAYGVVNVFMSGMSYLDLPTVMNESMRILGVEGEFSNFAQAKVWGTVAAIVLVIGWVVTAWLSMRRLRTGKVTWWLPLAGAAATMIVASVCITIPMMGDPAFIAYLDGATGR
ncbi:DUF6264 family protein [Microbacterium aerolatum]|uniref:DUF6264 family protein n=1 Tax=Microbacterium aerolatum TaxID=153731 RepID=UPI00200170D6|nr:DUF6264 family protein [Microbacterium aerolatum]MCK3770328.1 DUF6264 family protein [Microbacterium aerolatum]